MDDYVFTGALDIRKPGDRLEEDSKEVLEGKLSAVRTEIDSIRSEIRNLSEKLHKMEEEGNRISDIIQKKSVKCNDIVLGMPTLTKATAIEEKSEFLLNLFCGRKDVYAVRRWNEKASRAAYSPRCLNFWSEKCLMKARKEAGHGERPDCSTCEARIYEELTKEIVIHRQLKNPDELGRNAIGIYPMLPGNVCRFMAIDLDEASWKEDSLAIADIARRSGFQIAIERSFSGNGAHLWLFFSEEIPAVKVRKIAFRLIDITCRSYKGLSLKSYDRVFPSQDSVVDGGLGNLILMPLALGAAKRKENPGTVFVNNSFEMYPDQIAFLSSLPRYTLSDVDAFLYSTENSVFCSSGYLADFMADGVDVLWQSRLPKLGKGDCISDPLPVFLSSGLSIPKSALSAKMQDALKRLACFPNPEYFRAQRRNQGYAPFGIDSFVSAYVESDTVLQIPRGLSEMLFSYLDNNRISYTVIDKRTQATGIEVSFLGILRDEQTEALETLKAKDCGILRAATSFGKTVVAAALIAERREKTLVLVHKNDLLEQWREKLRQHLFIGNVDGVKEGRHVNYSGIGVLGGRKDAVTGYVDIASFQTVASRMPEFIREYGMVIVDECHHVAADTFLKVMNAVCPRYVCGLSATVKREDRLESLVFSQCGNVVFEYNADRLAYSRGIIQSFVPRFTSFSMPVDSARNFFLPEAIKRICADEKRNELIVHDATSLVRDAHKVIVLTGLVEHAGLLGRWITSNGCSVVVLTGRMSASELKDARDRLSYEDFDVIVATGRYLGEGTDIPSLDSLLIATPVSWEGVVSQYAGRIAREYEGKDMTYIYDYVDMCVPQLHRMYIKRMSAYRKLGYVVGEPAWDLSDSGIGSDSETDGLFARKTFHTADDILETLLYSFKCAEESIVISSPQLILSDATKSICSQLFALLAKGVTVEIRTNNVETAFDSPAQKESLEFLAENGVNCSLLDDCYLHFAVVDCYDTWFGDINLLGGAISCRKKQPYGNSERVMMHTFNSEAAQALVGTELGL